MLAKGKHSKSVLPTQFLQPFHLSWNPLHQHSFLFWTVQPTNNNQKHIKYIIITCTVKPALKITVYKGHLYIKNHCLKGTSILKITAYIGHLYIKNHCLKGTSILKITAYIGHLYIKNHCLKGTSILKITAYIEHFYINNNCLYRAPLY
jgi:hypothetical protein